MPLVRIDANQISNWDDFHDTFSHVFDFPNFYGRNMNAWIDCMTYLDESAAEMTGIHGSASDMVILHIDNIAGLRDEIYEALVECAAIVSWRRIEQGEEAILAFSFHK